MTEDRKRTCLVDLITIAIKAHTKAEFIRQRDLYLMKDRPKEEAVEILTYIRETPPDLIRYLEDNLWVEVLYKMRDGIELYQAANKLFAEYEAKHGG